jgi:lipopolysaccharide/colanic/teichoic acid biosynthesis glycosyltransferase
MILPADRSRRLAHIARRALDIAVVLAALPMVVPLVVLIAAAVKLDSPGPVFWRHTRIGRGGRPFGLWKFRTMCRDADRQKAQLMHLNALQWPDFKIANDPRVTRVGRWLRRTSLDELPQLWNILRGEMTLFGPRPCSVPVASYKLWQTERLEATPGLVGRWQATARNQADFDTRCRMDINQIRSDGPTQAIAEVMGTLRSLVTPGDY